MRNADKEIPAEATSGQIARIVGVTERIVAGRKADGRLPALPSGRIDLHAVVRAGVEMLARRAARRGGGGDGESGMDAAERFDAGMRAAVGTTTHLVARAIASPRPGEDVAAAAARGRQDALDMLGLSAAERD